MAHAPAVTLDCLSFDEREIVSLFTEATHADIESYSPARRPLYSTFRGIIINGRRYGDKVANCACSSMRLFAFGDSAYSVCREHGLQDIGMLRRDYPTNNHHARRSA